MIESKENKILNSLDRGAIQPVASGFTPDSGSAHQPHSRQEPVARDLERLFAGSFATRYQTVLAGGRAEPMYLPARPACANNRIYYREDYFASALHEVAHWCIAGRERRQQTDYGYWYAPDGRSVTQQRAFELAEQQPQALEWMFSIACGWPFCLSADNLNAKIAVASQVDFANAVRESALAYCEKGLPDRAGRFFKALCEFYRSDQLFSLSREVHDIVSKTSLVNVDS